MKVTVTYKETGDNTVHTHIVKVYTKTITLLEQIKSIPAFTYRALVLVFDDGSELPLNPKYFDVTIE